jgi:hypothetical protein
MQANDHQIGGTHYKTASGREHWDIVEEFNLDYFQGQVSKYLFRWKSKGGIVDLQKARHFLDKYIEIAEKKAKFLQAAKMDAGMPEQCRDLTAKERGLGTQTPYREGEYGGTSPPTSR